MIEFNENLGVLTAKLDGSKVVRARPASSDLCLILKLDSDDKVAGFCMLGPTSLATHSDRSLIPPKLLEEFDNWLSNHAS